MNERDALLAAILDQPGEDAVRLVYADWLQENGEGERADFVRVQVAIARIPSDPPPSTQGTCRCSPRKVMVCGRCRDSLEWLGVVARRDPLKKRERRLHESLPNQEFGLGTGWAVTPRRDKYDSLAIHGCPVGLLVRGFVEQITCPTDDFLTHGPSILAAHPVTTITLPEFRVEIAPPYPDKKGWHLLYYHPGTPNPFAGSWEMDTRAEMVERLIRDVRDLRGEFA